MTIATESIGKLLNPKSIAIIGIADPSDKSMPLTHWETMGVRALANLERFSFAGDLHLVSRSPQIGERATLASIEELPAGVDVALLAVDAEDAADTLRACAARSVRAAILYASGFAEAGPEGRARQTELGRIARESGILLLGPNTVGLSNFVEGVSLSFGNHKPIALTGKGVALFTQTGGVSGQSRLALEALGVPVSYSICTGNEAHLSIVDLIEFIAGDANTGVVLVYAEGVREGERLIAAIRTARSAGKHVVMLHPGWSEAARAAAAASTGAIIEDREALLHAIVDAGAIVVDTLEELWDAGEILLRFDAPPAAPIAVVTDGGVKGILADSCAREELSLAGFPPDLVDRLRAEIREGEPANPLDLSGQGLTDWDVYGRVLRCLLDHPAVGGIMLSIMPGPPDIGLRNARATLSQLGTVSKPLVYVMMGDTSPLAPELMAEMAAAGIPFRRSPERVIRVLARMRMSEKACA
ncbi:CoA-binding protein [Pacificimonas sp. ICDLI1SI03]